MPAGAMGEAAARTARLALPIQATRALEAAGQQKALGVFNARLLSRIIVAGSRLALLRNVKSQG